MQDLRLALRSLRATPIVTTVAILSLALGIGANTAIFSLVDSLLLRTLPAREPQRLVLISDNPASPFGAQSFTYPIWDQIRQRPQLFDAALAWSSNRFDLAAGGETEFVDGFWASGGLFDALGVPAMLGRTFTDADDQPPGASPAARGGRDGAVAVISYAFWQRRFGGAADAIGRRIAIERVPFTIVGVMPPGFFGPEIGRRFDIALPLGDEPLVRGKETFLAARSTWWLTIMARLKPGQSLESATAALRGVQPQIRAATLPDWPPNELGDYLKDPFTLLPGAGGDSGLRRRYERPLVTIMVVVALVLLIACANIANLLLARAAARRHEISVRLALGASRWRLARQFLTESAVLAAAGAALGLLVARWGSRLLVTQLSTPTNHVFLDLSIDWRMLVFTIGVTAGTALLFGIAPAFRAGDIEPMEAIKEHGRGSEGSGAPVFGGRVSLSTALVVAQVAVSVVLVVAAGLFVRTFSSLTNLRLGFEADRVLVVTMNALSVQTAPSQRLALFERARASVGAVPGVAGAALSVITPVGNMTWNDRISVPDGAPLPERQSVTNMNAITPGWLATFGTPLVSGRDFTPHDVKGSQPVALVNQAFARKFLRAGATPIGRIVELGGLNTKEAPKEIVGVVADAVYLNLRQAIPATMYVPMAQLDDRSFVRPMVNLSVRAQTGSPALLARSVAAAIGQVNPDLALTFRPLVDQVHASLTQERLVAMLAGFFGALALLLAGLGLYGVTSYAVSRRRTEIGIRMALGAAPAGVVRLVLSRVSWQVGAGVLLGAAVSLWASRFVATLLYGLEPRDPATLAAAAVVLGCVGGVAGWLPARRASRVDPAEVLRDS
jgi:putative ABC transport system permease protein